MDDVEILDKTHNAFMKVMAAPCNKCKHWYFWDKLDAESAVRCAAFPDGIPNTVLDGRNRHVNKIGDEKFTYEEIERGD